MVPVCPPKLLHAGVSPCIEFLREMESNRSDLRQLAPLPCRRWVLVRCVFNSEKETPEEIDRGFYLLAGRASVSFVPLSPAALQPAWRCVFALACSLLSSSTSCLLLRDVGSGVSEGRANKEGRANRTD